MAPLSPDDIRRAAEEGVISREDADRLLAWARQDAASVEPAQGLNYLTVAYYFGAMLMVSACAWFLGENWDALGLPGVFVTLAAYLAVALAIGIWLLRRGYTIGGGLLVTVSVCLIPLLTYSIEDMLGVWPPQRLANRPELAWNAHWPWIVVELATICAAATALWFIRFAVLIAPVATAIWLLALDLTAIFRREVSLDWGAAKWTTIAVGVAFMIAAWLLERQSSDAAAEDFAGWWYGAGLFAFWGGITALRAESEFHRALYALINVTLIAVAVSLRRVIFLVFGALGLHIYVGHLVYRVFKDSFLFPFVVAVLGLSMILVTVWTQRRLRRLSSWVGFSGLPQDAADRSHIHRDL